MPMRAALFYGGPGIRIEERPVPVPGPGEVRVRVRAAGICGSDLHNYRGHRESTWPVPWAQGHEQAGEVAALGEGVTALAVGDRVGVEAEHLIGCGACRHCGEGQYHRCPRRGVLHGARHASHGFSECDVTRAANCHRLPDHVSFEAAALLDCYACGVHAVHRTPPPVDGTTVILGAGAIALTLGQVAKAYGAGRVVMIGTRPEPLETARGAGAADVLVVSAGQDPVEAVRALTGGEGADVVYETVGGRAQLLDPCLAMARPGGAVVSLGLFAGPQAIAAQAQGMAKELTLRWSNSYSTWQGVSEYATALRLLASGRLDAAPIVTHRFPQADIATAFAAADDKRRSGAIRVIVTP
jgi:threonine dehydrogenase-like Zn-dependent dehydrogenase